MCFDMVQNGMSIQISQDYSSMVNFARCKCLGANVLRGPNQLPWDGKLEYDYQLWIDSDIVFTSEKFWQLCDLALPAEAINEDGTVDSEKEHQIAAGWYATEDGIRDVERSRGLGDVYKRQTHTILYHVETHLYKVL